MNSPQKILVVDDNLEDIALLSHILKQAGYEVSSANSPREGLQMAEEERFDLVLLDNRFQNSNLVGLSAVIEFIRKTTSGVVMLTAFGDSETETDATLLGARAYLSKPIEPESMVRTVRRLLSSKGN